MRSEPVKTNGRSEQGSTRRDVLRAAAATAVGCLLGPRGAGAQSSQPAASQPAAPTSQPNPWWLQTGETRSRVIDIRSNNLLEDSLVEPAVVGDMLDQGIVNLTRAVSVSNAWQTVLGPARRIVVKFNSVGARVINTNESLANVLVPRLEEAGYDRRLMTLVEIPDYITTAQGTRLTPGGWGAAIPVGDSAEPLAQYLYEADAIINVPLLKTHTIAGMSCGLKNLSHALIRHPARFHANGCSPYVGQVIASPEVHQRLRLTLVNAIRVLVDKGPDARDENIVTYGGILMGFDPVAVDNVGRSILAMERRRRGLDPWPRVPHLESAASIGLGRWRPVDIDRVALESDS